MRDFDYEDQMLCFVGRFLLEIHKSYTCSRIQAEGENPAFLP